jgi:hypothetical protein
MTLRLSFLAILTAFILINSNACAQFRESKPKIDTAHVHAISVADLEMIDPENRLIPESKENGTHKAITSYVESPLSSTHREKAELPEGKITSKDLEMLESMPAPKQASEQQAPEQQASEQQASEVPSR